MYAPILKNLSLTTNDFSNSINPKSVIRPQDVCFNVYLRFPKRFRLLAGILSAALSRRSPLHLRQRRLPIRTAIEWNRFGL